MSDAVLEAPEPAKPPKKEWFRERPPWLFTPETSRAANDRRREISEAESVSEPVSALDGYAASVLVRVRKQLDALDAELDSVLNPSKGKTIDPQAVERLTRAATALQDRERKLAGRPDPGTYRPTQRRSSRGGSLPQPL